MIETDIVRSAAYNALREVVDADKTLTAVGREHVLGRLSEILARHGLQDDIGIRLLHRHNDIAADEIMIEQEEPCGADDVCLATVAGRIPASQDALFANSWNLSGPDPIAVEFSIDEIVGRKAALVTENPLFLREFKDMLDALGVADLLGPCVLDRGFYARHQPVGGERTQLIETTDEARRANIVRFRPYASDRPFIETAWKATEFLATEVRMGCVNTPKCFPTAVIHCEPGPNDHKTTTENGHDVGSEHIGSPL